MAKSRPKDALRSAVTGATEVQAAGAALLVVDRSGAVIGTSGWEELFGDKAPGALPATGGSGDELLDAVACVVEESARRRATVRHCFGISLDRQRFYSLSAGPLPAAGRDPATALLALEITEAFKAGPKEGEEIRQLGHDLRTPLTSMSGAVELLGTGRLGPLSPEQGKLVGMLQKGIELMLSLIDEATVPYRAGAGNGSGSRQAAPEGGAGR